MLSIKNEVDNSYVVFENMQNVVLISAINEGD